MIVHNNKQGKQKHRKTKEDEVESAEKFKEVGQQRVDENRTNKNK